MRPHRQQPTRLLCPWNSPDKTTGVVCHSLLQGIFPTEGSNSGLLHCRWILYQLSHQGSPSEHLGCFYILATVNSASLIIEVHIHLFCRSGGLVFPSLSEFSTVYCDPHSKRLWHSHKAEIDVFSGTLLLYIYIYFHFTQPGALGP